jgi:hypothetical protein
VMELRCIVGALFRLENERLREQLMEFDATQAGQLALVAYERDALRDAFRELIAADMENDRTRWLKQWVKMPGLLSSAPSASEPK